MKLKQQSRLGIAALACCGIIGCIGGIVGEVENYMTVENPFSAEPEPYDLRVSGPSEGARSLPDGSHPVVVIVHGGYWRSGNFDDPGINPDMKYANDRGYMAVSVNYRLIDQDAPDGTAVYPWPAQIQDVKCAIKWVREQAEQNTMPYTINTDHIAVAGISAGGHLALMAAETPDLAKFEPTECDYDQSSEVHAAITYAGVGDLPYLWENNAPSAVQGLLGLEANKSYSKEDMTPLLEDATPKTYVDSNGVPVLLMHAQNDGLVHDDTVIEYKNVLDTHGRENFFYNPPTGGHTMTGIKGIMTCLAHKFLNEHFWNEPFDRETVVATCEAEEAAEEAEETSS